MLSSFFRVGTICSMGMQIRGQVRQRRRRSVDILQAAESFLAGVQEETSRQASITLFDAILLDRNRTRVQAAATAEKGHVGLVSLAKLSYTGFCDG
jgi:hypothetical protein